MLQRVILFLILFSFTGLSLSAQTIAEKKAQVTTGYSDLKPELQKFLEEMNLEFKALQNKLRELYATVEILYSQNAPPEAYRDELTQIRGIREEIEVLQETWRQLVVKAGYEEDAYALWHQPSTTLEELIVDYGSSDYIYLIPHDIAALQLSISSNIAIPRASWNQMLEAILNQSGIGVEQVNPYLRRLYFIKDDFSAYKLITKERQDLEIYPQSTRIAFVLEPEPADLKRTWMFLQKFVNPNTSSLEIIGRVIVVFSEVKNIKEILRIYDFAMEHRGELEYKAIPLYRVEPDDMANILSTMFAQLIDEPAVSESEAKTLPHLKKPSSTSPGGTLQIVPLTHIARALFLVGTKKEIQKAIEIIFEVENQVGIAREKTVYRYQVKHSDPEELANVLSKIYALMVSEGLCAEEQCEIPVPPCAPPCAPPCDPLPPPPPYLLRPEPPAFNLDSYYLQGGYVVNPRPALPGGPLQRAPNLCRENFIVDLKSSSIVMVVETDRLPKLKELLRKLDIPKKMVQVEALLFEKKLNRNTEYGLNLLNLGNKSTQTHQNNVNWNNTHPATGGSPANQGVLEFMLSRTNISRGIPGFDISYRFLMTQDDITINAAPSIVAVNQTPATININEEISLKTGSFPVATNNSGEQVFQNTYARAQYGITITVTPTIHFHDEDDCFDDPTDYITLDTDITFDTVERGFDPQQPNVNRRHIVNQVRIPDGESVILGGLRRKTTADAKEAIPFLGEIPGFGKLFSINKLEDRSTDMYILLTPKIISEPLEDFARIRRVELCKRPGDIPEFLCCLNAAREYEKRRLMANTMRILFDRPVERCIRYEGQYDGR